MPHAAEGRPPQTPAIGAQAGHRGRKTNCRPAKVGSVYPSTCLYILQIRWQLALCHVPMHSLSLRYMLYWKGRFLEQPVTEFCSVIKTNSTGPVGVFTYTLTHTGGSCNLPLLMMSSLVLSIITSHALGKIKYVQGQS